MSENEKKSKYKKIILLLLLLFFIVSGILIAIIINLKNRKLQLSMDDLSTGILPPWAQVGEGTLEDYEKKAQERVDKSMFSIEINSTPQMENGSAKANLKIQNPESNNYLMNVEIYLDSTGEKIYSSGLMKPNQYIDTDNLSKVLGKGNYKCTASFFAYAPETYKLMGKVDAIINLSVLN